jgi:serine/threonine protein phosphatase PrpC
MTLTLRYAVRTDPGLVRRTNQDSVYAGPRLLAVADGMGGMAAGDLASSVVITKLSELDQDVPTVTMIDALDQAVAAANAELRQGVDANPELRGMGTTLTALLFSGRAIAMVHIGDSRAYLLRDGRLRQVTKDHTYVQMLVDEGAITAEEASHHPHRSLVTQVLQGEPIEPNYSVREAIRGDRYLLCSDGLSNVVSPETMAEILREYRDPDACAERLIDLALRAGGPDNITAIVADLVPRDPSQPGPMAAVTHRADGADGATRRPSPRPRPPAEPEKSERSPESGKSPEPEAEAEPRVDAGPAEDLSERDGGADGASQEALAPRERSERPPLKVGLVVLLALVAVLAGVGIWYAAAG